MNLYEHLQMGHTVYVQDVQYVFGDVSRLHSRMLEECTLVQIRSKLSFPVSFGELKKKYYPKIKVRAFEGSNCRYALIGVGTG